MSRSPSLFISHGSPMFALEPGVLGPRLLKLGAALDDISSILVVSPHWQPLGLRVTAADHLPIICRPFTTSAAFRSRCMSCFTNPLVPLCWRSRSLICSPRPA